VRFKFNFLDRRIASKPATPERRIAAVGPQKPAAIQTARSQLAGNDADAAELLRRHPGRKL
jgi:hypothetical protein